jgi:N-acetylmuramoyl-L-alanine amidase
MRKINKIILHCTATPEGRPTSVKEIRSWHKARGFSDIGYHYIVHIDGSISKGRPEEKMGAHVQGHNKDSIGVAYVGGIDKNNFQPLDTRTEEQKSSLYEIIMNLMKNYPDATLHGHNEFSSKACPSFDVSKEYGNIICFFGRQ